MKVKKKKEGRKEKRRRRKEKGLKGEGGNRLTNMGQDTETVKSILKREGFNILKKGGGKIRATS